MDNRGMVPSSQVSSNGLERGFRHIPAKVHDDLPWVYDFLVPFLGGNVKGSQPIVVRHDLNDQVRSHLPLGIGGNDILKRLLSQFQCDITFVQPGKGNDLGEGSFQFTDIGFDVGGDVFDPSISSFLRSMAILVS